MDLDEWVETAPAALRESPMWKVRVYQIGTWVARLAAQDAASLERHPRFGKTVAQLVKSAGSVSATVAEGYSRQLRRERIKYYETPVFRYSMDYSLSLGWRRALMETGDRVTAYSSRK